MTDETAKVLAEIMSLSDRMDKHYTNSEAEEHVKELLKEMALERKVYKALISNFSEQIITNWCLINYATLNGHLISYKKHWQDELAAYMMKATKRRIKGCNTFDGRLKVIQGVWDEEEYSDTKVISMTIYGKFKSEQLDIKCPIYQQVLQNCKMAASVIINLIASGDETKVEQYVYGL